MALTRKVLLDSADRMQRLPVPGDADMDRIARRLERLGIEIIDLSKNRSWQSPASGEMSQDAHSTWLPASPEDIRRTKGTAASWYGDRFGVALNAETEIEIVPSVQTAMLMTSLAYIDVGDVTLIPDPGPPFYRATAVLAGGGVVPYHLYERNDYLPNFEGLQEGLMGRSRLMVLSYPHNPTSAMADSNILTQAVVFARRNNILIVFDSTFALAESGPVRPRAFLEVTGARNVGVEVLAPGILMGAPSLCPALIVGNREAIAATSFLLRTCAVSFPRCSIDRLTGLFQNMPSITKQRWSGLDESRHVLVDAFTEIGGAPRTASTVPYLWAAIPSSIGAEGYCRRVLRRTGVRLTPGTTYGERGEGFVRAVIPDDPAVARTVAERLLQHARLNQRRLPRARGLGRRKSAHGESAGN